jgi:hypothetical protein
MSSFILRMEGKRTKYLAHSQHSINISSFHSMQVLLLYFFPFSNYLMDTNSDVFNVCPYIFLYLCKIRCFAMCLISTSFFCYRYHCFLCVPHRSWDLMYTVWTLSSLLSYFSYSFPLWWTARCLQFLTVKPNALLAIFIQIFSEPFMSGLGLYA